MNMTGFDYFLIVSLRRCGSTFLQMSLNQEKDIFCDKEFVFRDTEYLQSNHIAVNEPAFSLRTAIDQIAPSARFLGSKVTIPEYQEDRLDEILKVLTREPLSIVHLTRTLAHQMISLKTAKLTKVWHVLDREKREELLPEWSKEAQGYISRDDHAQMESPRFSLTTEEVDHFCKQAVAIDRALSGLSETGKYIRIGLEDIEKRYSEVCKFLGVPNTSLNEKKAGLTSRVVKETHESLVDNWSEVESVFRKWEEKRSEFLI